MIPSHWMPDAKIERVILHWTAGSYKASDLDRQHYHVLIEGDGRLVKGVPSVALNSMPKAKHGYAAHTLNCNTGSIGVSMCAMAGAVQKPLNAGRYPLTRSQWNAAAKVVADLCQRYRIPVTPKTVLSHAEVQANLGIKQKGKWDIAILPFDTDFNTAKECGDAFREAVLYEMGSPAVPLIRQPDDPGVDPRPAKADTISGSKRFWTWMTTGGGTAALPFVDWRVQMLIVAIVGALAIYAIVTMPAVRKKLGLS